MDTLACNNDNPCTCLPHKRPAPQPSLRALQPDRRKHRLDLRNAYTSGVQNDRCGDSLPCRCLRIGCRVRNCWMLMEVNSFLCRRCSKRRSQYRGYCRTVLPSLRSRCSFFHLSGYFWSRSATLLPAGETLDPGEHPVDDDTTAPPARCVLKFATIIPLT